MIVAYSDAMSADTVTRWLAETGCRLAFTSDGDYAVIAQDGRLLAQGATTESAVRRARAALKRSALVTR